MSKIRVRQKSNLKPYFFEAESGLRAKNSVVSNNF